MQRRRDHDTAGLFEAFGWMLGYLFGQGIILAAMVGLLFIASFGFRWPDEQLVIRMILDLNLDRSFLLIGATSLGVLFLILPAVRLREGPQFRERIGWRLPTHEEIVYSLATVVPIATLGNLTYDVTHRWWSKGFEIWPFAAALRQTSLDTIYSTFQGVPYPVLVVALALGPAIGEELVFRGVIGRRLVNRFGLVQGILCSSILFALAHGSLPHILATLPVAILLHVLYIWTGTIWVPILVHFCNNLLAISMVRFQLGTQDPISPVLMTVFMVYLCGILYLLHTRRATRFGM